MVLPLSWNTDNKDLALTKHFVVLFMSFHLVSTTGRLGLWGFNDCYQCKVQSSEQSLPGMWSQITREWQKAESLGDNGSKNTIFCSRHRHFKPRLIILSKSNFKTCVRTSKIKLHTTKDRTCKTVIKWLNYHKSKSNSSCISNKHKN